MPHDLYTVQPNGTLDLHLHWGQWQAWESAARWVLVLAGTQSGKTSFGPIWLWREIQRCGPGDYFVVTPTFPLLELKALPEFRRLFESLLHLGRYVAGPVRKFVFSAAGLRRMFAPAVLAAAGDRADTTVYFGHAQDPDSLESATAKAAWIDEAGQKKFRLGSWRALQRRLALHQGRALLTTTPYDLGWLKQQLYDKRATDPDIAVITFASTMNPAFPAAEMARARRDMPGWQFRMFYQGQFERPAGLIYDSFDATRHTVPRFAIPPSWPRHWGLDFGGVHTAALYFAEEPGTSRLYAYREYLAGGRTAVQHAAALLAGEPGLPASIVGGSRSEGQWRQEFRQGGTVDGVPVPGLPVREPLITEVEVGINRVYGCSSRDELYVFADLAGYLDQKATYARVLDANGQPTEVIEDKATYHYLDAERYILSALRPGERRAAVHYGVSMR